MRLRLLLKSVLNVSSPLLIIVCFAFLFLFSCTAQAGDECSFDKAAPLRFTADDETVFDQYGRAVIFRGVNLPSAYHYPFPYKTEDIQTMEKFGYNFIRLITSWRSMEPEEGTFDTEHAADYRNFIVEAQKHGIYTMLDVHQVQWCIDGGMIPYWMCEELSGHGIMVDTIKKETDRFWGSDELQSKFVKYWEFLAKEFKGVPGLAAYDLLNEPFSYDAISYGKFEKCCLYPFYNRVIKAVRAIDPDTTIALEPPPLNVLLPAYTVDFKYDNLIWAPHSYFPHSYGKGLSIDKEETPADVRAKYKRLKKEAEGIGAPLMIGEFGMAHWHEHDFMPPWLEENMKMQERLLAHSAVWDYSRGDYGWGVLDKEGNPHPDKLPILHRPYPRYTAGTPDRLMFDPEKKEFRYRFTADPGICAPTEIYLPPELFDNKPMIKVNSSCDQPWDYNPDMKVLMITSQCTGETDVMVFPGF